MLVVAIAAVLTWITRTQNGRTSLVLAGLILGGLAIGIGLSIGMDRLAGIHPRRDRED